MKHIKRKFLLSHNIKEDVYDYILNQDSKSDSFVFGDYVPHLITSKKEMIQSFFYELNGEKYAIPEPNPIIIYFSNAQGFLSVICQQRDNLFNELESSNSDVGNILNQMFSFYGSVVNYSSSLFDSLEAFINSKIPKDFKYKNPNRKNKIMNKYEILRHITFENKIKTIIPEIYLGKNFVIEKSHLFDNIMELKRLRDNITHTKANLDYDVNYYEQLFTEALDFDYLKAIESAKGFINFYEENLIEPCNCGLKH